MRVMDMSETSHGRVDKVSRYGWTIKDQPGQLAMIHKDRMQVDDTYQRDATATKIAAITADWSWVACGALIVAQREDGSLWVIDGQHRLLGARRRSDITELPCLVFQSTGKSVEAQGFLDVNDKRKPINALQKQRASVIVGDEVATFVAQSIEECGLILTGNASVASGIKFVALLKRYAAQDRERFIKILRMCTELSIPKGVRMNSRLFEGLWYLQTHINALDDSRFVARLRDIGALRLIDIANRAAALLGHGHAKTYAEGMLQEINKGLRNKFTLEKGE